MRCKHDRRRFLKTTGLLLAAGSCVSGELYAMPFSDAKPLVRFCMLTDPHYADAMPRMNRYYRESLGKLDECVGKAVELKADFLIELGDFKDQSTRPTAKGTLAFLQKMEERIQCFSGSVYHVLGNHDMDSISKEQFLGAIKNGKQKQAKANYAFDCKGVRFVVLDPNYLADGKSYDSGNYNWTDSQVPENQCEWLKKQLAEAPEKVVVFIHQRLDGEGSHFVRNADKVRGILEESGKVLAVFQGHDHKGACLNLKGIHYYTLCAMVEGSGPESSSYALVEIMADGEIVVTGYRRAVSKKLAVAI